MRTLEILTSILLFIYVIGPIIGRKRLKLINLLPAVTLVVIATHAMIEGPRWQMIPLYVFSVIATLISIPALLKTNHQTDLVIRPFRIILSLSLLAVSTALPILLPVPAIPAPSGPYQVGTRIYELTDESRTEIYSGKDEARRFIIQLWYPSEPSVSDVRAPWMANAEIYAPAIATYIDLPSFFLDHLALVKIPAYIDSPVAQSDDGFPIILFSHGWNGFNAQNTGQALELASHGYIVVGVQHTYGAVVTVFEDGTVAKNNPNALPSGAPDDEYEQAAHLLSDQWAGDMSFLLDILARRSTSIRDPFWEKLDFSRVGAYGHSTGGGAAIQFCGTDPRCQALLGQDPFMRPVAYEILDSGITQPSFYMFSQRWADDVNSRNNKLFNPFYESSVDTYGAVYIEGTDHYDFADLPLLTPLAPQLGLKGPINGKRVTVIVNDYLLSFFDLTLKGKATSLFENSSLYQEIQLMNP